MPFFCIKNMYLLIIKMVIKMYYINTFLIYSILGFIMESALYKIYHIHNYSGFLIGPFTPIYGIGAITILLINKYIINKITSNKILKIIYTFIICTIILTLIEFIGGLFLYKILNIELWNYTNKKFNIGKYICLELSLVWGIFSIIFLYIIKPFMDKFIKKIPKKSTYLFSILVLIDFIYILIKKG